MSDARKTLFAKAMWAFKWNALGVVVRIAMQFVVMIVLARLLGPADFGFFGGSLLVFGLALLVADLGLATALVQRAELDRETRRAAWGRLFATHVAVAAAVWFAAPWLGGLLGESGVAEGIRGTVPALLITAFMVMPAVELRRRLDFRRLQFSQMCGYFAGYVLTAIPLSVYGWGGWSLIAALVVQQAVMAAMCMAAAPQPLYPRWAPISGAANGFGLRVTGSNLSNWVAENLDNLLVARFKGLADLGTYSVAYNLARTPVNHMVAMLQQVVFAAGSRAQDDHASLQKAYLALVKAIALVSFPVFFAAAMVADSVIDGLYGAPWQHAGPVFAAVCVAMPFHALMAVAGPLLAARGRPGDEFKVQFAMALLLAAVLWALKDGELVHLAWGVCGVYVARAVFMSAALIRELGLTHLRVLRALRSPLLLTALVLAALGAFSVLDLDAMPIGRLLGMIVVAGATVLLAALGCMRALLGEELAFLCVRFPILGRLRLFSRAGV